MRYAAEDCPVNRMKDRDAGAWDAQALCGLFQCPGCGLTPDHPLMTCFSQQLNLGFHD